MRKILQNTITRMNALLVSKHDSKIVPSINIIAQFIRAGGFPLFANYVNKLTAISG